jgi:predicted GIY-YIG superfamily endonuclease
VKDKVTAMKLEYKTKRIPKAKKEEMATKKKVKKRISKKPA